jgi:glycerol-3-phosphate dehydrogenase
MPIADAVYRILYEYSPAAAEMSKLMDSLM